MELNRASKYIVLTLMPLSILFLGYKGCDDPSAADQFADDESQDFASTQPSGFHSTSGSSYHSSSHSFWSSSGRSSSSSSHSSGVSRGGFGSSGHGASS